MAGDALRDGDSPRRVWSISPAGADGLGLSSTREHNHTDNPDVEVANLRFDLGRRLNNCEILKFLMAGDALWDGDSPRRACGVSHQPERMVSGCLQHGSTTMLLNLKRRFSAS